MLTAIEPITTGTPITNEMLEIVKAAIEFVAERPGFQPHVSADSKAFGRYRTGFNLFRAIEKLPREQLAALMGPQWKKYL